MVRILSPNAVKSKSFRAKLKLASNAADEAKISAEVALQQNDFESKDGWIKPVKSDVDEEKLPRSDLEVKVKLFLSDFGSSAASEAIEAVKTAAETDFVESVQLTIPTSGLDSLAIAQSEKPKDAAYEECLKALIDLYKSLEVLVEAGVIKSLGLCDIEVKTLSALCEAVKRKPSSVTVGTNRVLTHETLLMTLCVFFALQLNMASCCVVPNDLQEFCKAVNIKLLTHSDPAVVLSNEDFKAIEKKQFLEPNCDLKVSWVVRFHIMDASRGVLRDKRYIIGLQ